VHVGSHRLEILAPGIAIMICAGDVSTDDVQAVAELLAIWTTRRLVIDLRGMGQVPKSTRRLLTAEPLYEPQSFGLVGGSLRARLVATSLLVACKLMSRAAFFRDLAEAIEWAETLEENVR
jgi:hypothetical protein